MFYLQKFWVYNFGIHNCSNGSAVMWLWDESISGRGLIMFTEVLYRKYTMSLKKAYFTLITVLARIKIPSSFVSGAGWWSLRKVHSYRSQIFSVAYLPSL